MQKKHLLRCIKSQTVRLNPSQNNLQPEHLRQHQSSGGKHTSIPHRIPEMQIQYVIQHISKFSAK